MMELKREEKDENYADAVVLGIILSEFAWNIFLLLFRFTLLKDLDIF